MQIYLYIDDVLIIQVDSTIDTDVDNSAINYCNKDESTVPFKCNLRSAWEICNSMNYDTYCIIKLPTEAVVEMHMDYGSLLLSSGSMLLF